MGGADVDSPNLPPKKLDKEELSLQFDRSITFVRSYTLSIERDYARPLLKFCYAFVERRPISAVFIGFFSFLSFLPIISFIGISLFTTVIFTVVALGAALVVSAGIVLGQLAVLFIILTATFFTSICLSLMTISTFLFFRLIIFIRREGSRGLSLWLNEIQALAMGAQSKMALSQNSVNAADETCAHTPLQASTPDSSAESGSHPTGTDIDRKTEAKEDDQFDYVVKDQVTE
ncbi:hypothetical protein BDN70DRAFT_883500 [Pholiota conissans]|uniref:Promethin n=1 Tax=Pholiota conissans TaxID=109636 RepID=A0A9P5YV01_9AGAR|nr:hypothetical protein BDN70DRAFT_883500 [Pholiota conissans]